MNLTDLQRALLAAARAQPPDERVPYAFEKRIMARLRALPAPDEWSALWARALWRAAAPCVALMLLLSAWSMIHSTGSAPSTDLSQDIENIVLAAADQEPPTDSVW